MQKQQVRTQTFRYASRCLHEIFEELLRSKLKLKISTSFAREDTASSGRTAVDFNSFKL
jgi:hypothetical protein